MVLRFFVVGFIAVAVVVVGVAASIGSWAWWVLVALLAGLLAVGVYDLTQRRHSVLRNYPILGHMRYLLESLRPELQQYFIERNFDGRPFDRDVRTIVYERSKGIHGELSFGTERDIEEVGYEYLVHSIAPVPEPQELPRVLIGGPDCTKPYSMSLLNVSSMSFGALSANALRALNKAAALGGFAHDTGEGGLTPYHLEGGGDLVWEIGSGYFGTRTAEGRFDPDQFADKVRTRPREGGRAQAQPGRQARSGRRTARGEGQRGDRSIPRCSGAREMRESRGAFGVQHPSRADPGHRADARAVRR